MAIKRVTAVGMNIHKTKERENVNNKKGASKWRCAERKRKQTNQIVVE